MWRELFFLYSCFASSHMGEGRWRETFRKKTTLEAEQYDVIDGDFKLISADKDYSF